MLVSVDYLFSFTLRVSFFLVGFWWKPGCLRSYVTRCWMLLKSAAIAGLLWLFSDGFRRHSFFTARWGYKSSSPLTPGGVVFLITPRCGCGWKFRLFAKSLLILFWLKEAGVSYYCPSHGLHWHQGDGDVLSGKHSLIPPSGERFGSPAFPLIPAAWLSLNAEPLKGVSGCRRGMASSLAIQDSTLISLFMYHLMYFH